MKANGNKRLKNNLDVLLRMSISEQILPRQCLYQKRAVTERQ
ncbi:MAG: hypothetical protein K0S44_1132 [Bacteroidetes bacterium]|nr:hypothetical protein [Bacteroidota bacterium]